MTQRNQYNVVAIFHLNWLWASGFGDDKRRVKVSQNKRQKKEEKEEEDGEKNFFIWINDGGAASPFIFISFTQRVSEGGRDGSREILTDKGKCRNTIVGGKNNIRIFLFSFPFIIFAFYSF